jgi:hypothetical protein
MKLWSDAEVNCLGNIDKRRLDSFSYRVRDLDFIYYIVFHSGCKLTTMKSCNVLKI